MLPQEPENGVSTVKSSPNAPFRRAISIMSAGTGASFDVPEGMTLDDAILEELRTGLFGRCVYRCDNDVVDRQLLSMEMDDAVVVSLSMEMFSNDDFRRTHIWMTGGEIDGDERTLRVRKFRGGYERTYDFSDIAGQSFHAGADLYLIDDFIQALYDPDHVFLTSIEPEGRKKLFRLSYVSNISL